MSMITGCPACGTLFKVVADQLKISDGWVRCGHCSEVFDAAAHMQLVDQEAARSAPDASITMSAPLATIPAGLPTSAPPAPAFDAAPPGAAMKAEQPVSVLPSYFPADAIEVREVDSPSQLDAEPPPMPPARRPAPDTGYPLPMDFGRSEIEASRPRIDLPDQEGEGPLSIYDPALDKVTFVRAARRKALWKRPGVRLVLLLVLGVLAGVLAAQVAVQERDQLAALHPQWRPVLQAVCLQAGCKVGPQRRIDSVAIDSSGFTRLRADAFRLSVTLRNLSPQPVAMPALELTLTDSQDQPLVRKVILPRELGATAPTLAASADVSASAAIAVGGTDATRVAGYRLLAFYP
ncbi:MAG: DUF3426 domain-containing protein [Ramlibacter sp.]